STNNPEVGQRASQTVTAKNSGVDCRWLEKICANVCYLLNLPRYLMAGRLARHNGLSPILHIRGEHAVFRRGMRPTEVFYEQDYENRPIWHPIYRSGYSAR